MIGRLHEIARPSLTSCAAPRRTSGVMKFSVPSSSSVPHRPQLVKRVRYSAYSSAVGGVRSRSPIVAGGYRRSSEVVPCRAHGLGRGGVRPLLAGGHGRPVPDLPRTARPSPRATASTSTTPGRCRASTTCGTCWPIASASRSSEGPVFHRDRLLRHNDGAPDTSFSPAGAQLLDARPAAPHAPAPGDDRSVPAPCRRPARGRRPRARGRAARRARGPGPLRRAPRLRVAGRGRGRRSADRRARERRRRPRHAGQPVRATRAGRSRASAPRAWRRGARSTTISATSSPPGGGYVRTRRRSPVAPIRPTSSTACSRSTAATARSTTPR